MVRAGWRVVVCVLALMISGCVVYQSGVVIKPEVVGLIQKNVTTRAQVEGLFGPPMNVDMINVGERILKYSYVQVYDKGRGLFVADPGTVTRHQVLLVWIGPNNVVRDFEFTDYVTDVGVQGTAEVVRRAAVSTQPGAKPVWYSGGEL